MGYKRVRPVGLLRETCHTTPDADEKFWANMKLISSFQQKGPVSSLSFAFDSGTSALLIAASLRVTSRQDSDDFQREKNFYVNDEGVCCVSYRSDGRMVAIGSKLGKILVVEASSRKILREFTEHSGALRCVKFLEDKIHLISAGDDGAVCVWDIARGALVWKVEDKHKDYIRSLSLCSDNSGHFITGSYDHSLLLWNISNPVPLLCLDNKCPIEAVCFVSNEMAATAGDRSIKIWDLKNGVLIREMLIHHKAPTSLLLSPDKRFLLSSSLDHSLKIVRLSDYRLVFRLKLPSSIMCMSVKGIDRILIAIGTASGHVFVYGAGMNYSRTLNSRSLPNACPPFVSPALILPKNCHEPLMQFDRLLKAFRYRKAFDSILARSNPSLLISSIRELIKREGLSIALSGRSDAEVVVILQKFRQNIYNPRYTETLIDAFILILEIYSQTGCLSSRLVHELQETKKLISTLIKANRCLMELEGQLDLLSA